jgi:hypothetical protein
MPWRVVESSFLAEKWEPQLNLTALEKALLENTPLVPGNGTARATIAAAELASLLAKQAEELHSWDRLLAWCHAADVVVTEAELLRREEPVVGQARMLLTTLQEEVNSLATDRYATPRYAASASPEADASLGPRLQALAAQFDSEAFRGVLAGSDPPPGNEAGVKPNDTAEAEAGARGTQGAKE